MVNYIPLLHFLCIGGPREGTLWDSIIPKSLRLQKKEEWTYFELFMLLLKAFLINCYLNQWFRSWTIFCTFIFTKVIFFYHLKFKTNSSIVILVQQDLIFFPNFNSEEKLAFNLVLYLWSFWKNFQHQQKSFLVQKNLHHNPKKWQIVSTIWLQKS